MILNSVFEDKVVVNSDEIFDNCQFVSGTVAKQKGVFALTVSDAAKVTVKDCRFANKGYSAIYMNAAADLDVVGCDFICGDMYNPIEGSQSVENGNISVKDCTFVGAPGNNYVNFYKFANNAANVISNCTFEPTVDNNIVRISNRTSAAMNLKVENCRYNFAEGEATEYTGFLLCQDYTNKSGTKQDFSGVSVELENVFCDDKKVTSDGAAKGCIFYVYEDGKGIITDNNPVVTVK